MAEFRHETERLVLRDWREEDWEPFFQGTNTPAVMQWLGGLLDDERKSDVRARLERYQSDFGHTFWAVERKDDGAILGFCGLKRCTDENGPFGEIEAGWRLREDAWSKGYAKEAARASIHIGFTQFGADQIIALTVEGNAASWGLMLRLGMKRRSDLDFEDAFWSEGYGPVIVHAITRERWDRQRA